MNIIYAVKGGVPSVGISDNPNFYLLCNDFNSNIGYIEQKEIYSWRLYTRCKSILSQYSQLCDDGKKFYYNGKNFQECVNKLEEVTGRKIKIITTAEVIELKKSYNN